MNKRNLTTTAIVVTAGLLLYGGVTLAREQQPRDDRGGQFVTPAATDDRAPATATPELEPSAPDDKGGTRVGSDDAATPSASADDKGGNRAGSDDSSGPTASPAPTSSPDDHGGSGGGSDDSPTPTASPDDHGGHGSDG
jgi:hypothetical protein